MFILAVILIVVGTSYYATLNSREDIELIVSIISLAIAIPIVFALAYVRLETRIDREGITTQFKPFRFTRKHFIWQDIKECYVREFEPIQEYGGWGIRGLGRNKKAYHIYGTKGIQIKTTKGDDFLIGTQRPKSAKDIINLYSTS